MQQNKFLENHKGDKSSKRAVGVALVVQGSLMKLILFFAGMVWKLATDFDKLDSSGNYMIGFGAGLLGWGVFEGKKIFIGKK